MGLVVGGGWVVVRQLLPTTDSRRKDSQKHAISIALGNGTWRKLDIFFLAPKDLTSAFFQYQDLHKAITKKIRNISHSYDNS